MVGSADDADGCALVADALGDDLAPVAGGVGTLGVGGVCEAGPVPVGDPADTEDAEDAETAQPVTRATAALATPINRERLRYAVAIIEAHDERARTHLGLLSVAP